MGSSQVTTLAVNFKMAAARLLVISRKCIAVEGLYQQKMFQREIKNKKFFQRLVVLTAALSAILSL